MLIVALLLQAAGPPVVHSILRPVDDQPCTRAVAADEVVVCAEPLPQQALPLPGEAVSPRPGPVNRDMTGVGALTAEASPCATRVGGCQTGLDVLGMGTALIRGVQKLVAPGSCCERSGEGTSAAMLIGDVVNGVARTARSRPDKTKRVAIDLNEPVLAGRVHP